MYSDPYYIPPVRPDSTPRLLDTLFRVVGPSKRPVRCATYRVLTGIELRLEYEHDEDNLLRSQLFRRDDPEAICELAAEWRGKFDEHGFTDLPL